MTRSQSSVLRPALWFLLPVTWLLIAALPNRQYEVLGPYTANGATDVSSITSTESDNTAGIQIFGTWGTAEATVEMRLCPTCTWLPVPGASNPYSADAIIGPMAVYRDTELRFTLATVDGSTSLSYYLAR